VQKLTRNSGQIGGLKRKRRSQPAQELSRRVSELKQELDDLPPERQDAFRELLAKQTRYPRKRIA